MTKSKNLFLSRRNLLISAGLILIASVLIFGLNHSSAQASTPSTPDDTTIKVPDPAPSGSTIKQRLALRKQQQNVQLNEQDINHLEGACTQAQSKVRAIINTTSSMLSTREYNYATVDALIWLSIGQIKLHDGGTLRKIDTFHFDQDLQTYESYVAEFQMLDFNYQEALSDLTQVNCQVDPTGFQALLQTARAYYAGLGKSATKISDFVQNRIIQTQLSNYITKLQPKYQSTNTDNTSD